MLSPVTSQRKMVLVLDVRLENGVLKVSASEKDQGEEQTLRHYLDHEISETTIRQYTTELITCLNKANKRGRLTDESLNELKRYGQRLFDSLLPLTVKSLVSSSSAADLIVHMNDLLVDVPWELLFDGKDFLSLRFNMGRVVSTKQPVHAKTSRLTQGSLRMWVIADPKGDLEYAYQEGIELRNALDPYKSTIKIDLKTSSVDSEAFKLHLRDYDILHYAGHAYYDNTSPEKSGFLLEGSIFSARDALELVGERPLPALVFSNACQSGYSGPWQFERESLQKVYGMANAFLLAGARHFIGTLFRVGDEESKNFACYFYEQLLAGNSIGAALRQARLKMVKQYGYESLGWAGYVLYGDPTYALFPSSRSFVASKKPPFNDLKESAVLMRTPFDSFVLGVKFFTYLFLLTVPPILWLMIVSNTEPTLRFLPSTGIRDLEISRITLCHPKDSPTLFASLPGFTDVYEINSTGLSYHINTNRAPNGEWERLQISARALDLIKRYWTRFGYADLVDVSDYEKIVFHPSLNRLGMVIQWTIYIAATIVCLALYFPIFHLIALCFKKPEDRPRVINGVTLGITRITARAFVIVAACAGGGVAASNSLAFFQGEPMTWMDKFEIIPYAILGFWLGMRSSSIAAVLLPLLMSADALALSDVYFGAGTSTAFFWTILTLGGYVVYFLGIWGAVATSNFKDAEQEQSLKPINISAFDKVEAPVVENYLNAMTAKPHPRIKTWRVVFIVGAVCATAVIAPLGVQALQDPRALLTPRLWGLVIKSFYQPGSRPILFANLNLKIGQEYIDRGDWDRAFAHYEIALSWAEKSGYSKEVALVYMAVANLESSLGKITRGIEVLDIALEKGRKAGLRETETYLLQLLGERYAELGQFEKAEQFFNESLKIQERFKQVPPVDMYTNLAYLESKRGNYKQAIEYMKHLYLTIENSRYKDVVFGVSHDLANYHLLLGDVQVAKDWYARAERIARENNHAVGALARNSLYFDLGRLAHEESRFQLALDHVRKAFEFCKRNNHKAGIAGTLQEEADILADIGDLNQAELKSKEALGILQTETDWIEGLMRSHNTLAKIYFKKGMLVEAESAAGKVYKLYQQAPFRESYERYLLTLGEIRLAQDRKTEAVSLYTKGLELEKVSPSAHTSEFRNRLQSLKAPL